MGPFKAYDVRGVFGEDLTSDIVYHAGYFLPQVLGAAKIAVGRDVRVSSPEMFDSLTRGITDAGSDVIDLGLATTPFVYFATCFLGVEGSVQITASHNPKQYNGLKISRRDAIPVGLGSGLEKLEDLVMNGKVTPAAKKGSVIEKDLHSEYVAFFQKHFDSSKLENLNITFDLSNGMSTLFATKLFGTGKGRFYINDTPDGTFPQHEPNPLETKNCAQLSQAVVSNHSDVGVIFDGDADRVVFVDEKGAFIQPDYITAVLGHYFKDHGKTGACVVDIRTSKSAIDYLEGTVGDKVSIWKVGHAFAKMKIRELNAVFGGELAGHYYYRDFFWCDSGIFSAFIVLNVLSDLKKQGKTLSEFMRGIVKYSNSGECNFRLENKDAAIEKIYSTYAPQAQSSLDFDGYRMDFGGWWFSIRKSNTEPLLRLICEAGSEAEMKKHLRELSDIIQSYK